MRPTSAPSFPSSVTMAFMRSVSFTRQLYTFLIAVGPFANSAATARVMAASGMSLQSWSMPCS